VSCSVQIQKYLSSFLLCEGPPFLTVLATTAFVVHPVLAPFLVIQYDQSVGTFSPDGKIYQVEYALKAVESAGYVSRACNGCSCLLR
jgi:hypothetical protein